MSGTRVQTLAAVAAVVMSTHAPAAQDARAVPTGATPWSVPSLAGVFARADVSSACDAGGREVVLPPLYAGMTSIEQSPGAIVLRNRHAGRERTIVLAGPRTAESHRYLGEARGHWEGETLVITSTRLHPSVLAALTHRDAALAQDVRLIERLTPTPSGTLEYEFAVDDPWHYAGGLATSFVLARVDGEAEAAEDGACAASAGR